MTPAAFPTVYRSRSSSFPGAVHEARGPCAGEPGDWDLPEVADEVIRFIQTRRLDRVRAPMIEIEFTPVYDDGRDPVTLAVVSAGGVTLEGRGHPLALDVGQTDDHRFWLRFFHGLRARGLTGVRKVMAPPFRGLAEALQTVYPAAGAVPPSPDNHGAHSPAAGTDG